MRAKWRDPKWPLPSSPDDPAYAEILRLKEEGDSTLWALAALNDFWFFCRHVSRAGEFLIDSPGHPLDGKPWLDHPWLFERCREIQANPDGRLRLWPRFHFKTTLDTQNHTLWDLTDNPDLRVGIITYKLEKVGDTFLSGIKEELERNPRLHELGEELLRLFPGREVNPFWKDPLRDCRVAKVPWNNEMLSVNRLSAAREPSITVTSLVAPMTSFHWDIRLWDDLVAEDAVRSKEAIEQTTQLWRNLAGTAAESTADRYVGTHWAVNDTYQDLIDLGVVELDHQPLYKSDGVTPVLRTVEWVESMRVHMGPYRFAAQMLNDPMAAGRQTFDVSWLHYDELDPKERGERCNRYIFAETATAKKGSDFCVIWVVGLGRGVPVGNYYLLDLVRDRMGMIAFVDILFQKVEVWEPRMVFLEQVGAARDIDYIREKQRLDGFDFRIVELDDKTKKEDRIQRLQAPWAAGNIIMPRKILGRTEGRPVNLIQEFIKDEFIPWNPSSGASHDDQLDCLAHMMGPRVKPFLRFPTKFGTLDTEHDKNQRSRMIQQRRAHRNASWAI